MAAQKKLFNKLMWLINTINSAGKINVERINRRWSVSIRNEDKEPEYGIRQIYRHKEMIEELFNIKIKYNKVTHEYSIDPFDEDSSNSVSSWLINTYAINNIVNSVDGLKDRIIFEDIPAGLHYLSPIVSAMMEECKLEVTYQKFGSPEPHTFLLIPYCIKEFRQRWYLIGKPEDHPEESDPRTYSFDRVKKLVLTEVPGKMPKDFNAKDFFANHFGVDRSIPSPERIRIKTTPSAANYIRSLTLHGSQVEVEKNEEYSIFCYYIAPTFDFIQELRKYGSELEVLEPQSLREKFREESRKLWEMYKDKE